MGDSYQSIVDLEATPDVAEGLAARVIDFLVTREVILPSPSENCVLGGPPGHPPGPKAPYVQTEHGEQVFSTYTNGVQTIAERHVYYSVGSDAICPACKADFGVDWPAEIRARLNKWWKDGGGTYVMCPKCAVNSPFECWLQPPWALGHLGFTFWNWWSLKEDFVATIAELLQHRVVVVCGKI